MPRQKPKKPKKMTDFGVVALDGQRQISSYLGLSQVGSQYLRGIVSIGTVEDFLLLSYYDAVGVTTHVIRSGRDDSVGNPTPPSQIQGRPGVYTNLVPVTVGVYTISIDVLIGDHDTSDLSLQSPHPRLTVKANPEVGLLVDLVSDAVAQIGWQTLTIAFTVAFIGAVKVEREKRYKGMDDVVNWDNFVVRRL